MNDLDNWPPTVLNIDDIKLIFECPKCKKTFKTVKGLFKHKSKFNCTEKLK